MVSEHLIKINLSLYRKYTSDQVNNNIRNRKQEVDMTGTGLIGRRYIETFVHHTSVLSEDGIQTWGLLAQSFSMREFDSTTRQVGFYGFFMEFMRSPGGEDGQSKSAYFVN